MLVLGFFTVIAVLATWPLARHPLGGFYGFGNDNLGSIWVYGWIHDGYFGPASASFSPKLQAPFGYEIPGQALQPLDKLFALLAGGADQGLGAYNLQIFLSFVLAGSTMYLLARYVTRRPLASAIAGLIFTLSPFHLAQSMQYASLASIQWIPVFVLALLLLLREPKLRYAVLAGVAFSLVAAASYYHAWFLGWFTAIVVFLFAIHLGWQRLRQHRLRWAEVRHFAWLVASRVLVGLVVTLVILGPVALTSLQAASEERVSLTHPLSEAVRYSGRPWMLFVPPHDHPIFGTHVRGWVERHLYDNPLSDQSLYLGYVALFLAALGLFWRMTASPSTERLARRIFTYGGLTGLVMLLGPFIPLDRDYWRLWYEFDAIPRIPSLGLAMFDASPVFRFFSRAFVLVSVCLAGLAAIGFARLEMRIGPKLIPRLALAGVFGTLIGVEYANAPPHRWVSDRAPPWVAAVRSLPPDASIAQYPVATLNSPRSFYYMFWQRVHGRSTINPHSTPESQAFAGAVQFVDDSTSGKALSDAGIDYAVVHTALPLPTTPPYQPGSFSDVLPRDAGALNPWLQRVLASRDAVVYRVRQTPRPIHGAVIREGAGFGLPEPEGAFVARWIEAPTGELALFVAGPRRKLRARLELSSFARPRTVVVALGGRRVATLAVPTGRYEVFSVPLGRLAPGRYKITLSASPGPQSVGKTIGTNDPRSVSIRLKEPIVID